MPKRRASVVNAEADCAKQIATAASAATREAARRLILQFPSPDVAIALRRTSPARAATLHGVATCRARATETGLDGNACARRWRGVPHGGVYYNGGGAG
jgi:hypothetical protein